MYPKNYRYALSITSQFYFCGVPFRLDIKNNCPFGCSYCFAMARGGRKSNDALLISLDSFYKKIKIALDSKDNTDINGVFLRNKMPIHLGGVSDPFADVQTSNLTLKLLKILSDYNYPVILCTKNTSELVKDKTLNILKKMKYLSIQTSFTTSEDSIAKSLEPNAPLASLRLLDLRKLSDERLNCTARIQPIIPPLLNNIKKELIPALIKAGCQHIILEHLKLPVEKTFKPISEIFNTLNWNGFEYYEKHNAELVGREWLLPINYKREVIQPIITTIQKEGLTFGLGDYGLNHLGNTNCCCGIDKMEGFSSWFKGNFSYVIKNAKLDTITFEEVEEHWIPEKSISMYVNSHSRLNNKKTVKDYLLNKWNHPGTANAPDSYFGVTFDGDFDEKGNCVYHKHTF